MAGGLRIAQPINVKANPKITAIAAVAAQGRADESDDALPGECANYRVEVTSGALRDRIVERVVLEQHDGASGAGLERARLDDGSLLVLKTFDPDQDLSLRIPGRVEPLDVALWRAGTLDRLPPPIGHAIRDAWTEDGTWILAMVDLHEQLLDYRSVVSREQCRRILAAAVAMHGAFAGEDIDGLWPLEQRLLLFSSRTMEPFRDTSNPLPGLCLDGWERFATVAPPDVVELVASVHDRPEILADPMAERGGRTLLHGDYWIPNMAPSANRIDLIDWGLATSGPPVVEFASFLVGCSNQVRASRDDILDDLRHLWGARHDEKLLRLGLAVGVVEMGWNLALQATQEPGDTGEALGWWVAAARRAVDTGLIE